MKITAVKVYMLEKKLSSTMCISRGGFTVRNHAIVEVSTDAGITGLGEGIGNARFVKAIIEERMAAMAIGCDPMCIETVRQKLLDSQVYFERMGSAICAASAIEMALWDIKGKALKVPVYELLGGKTRDTLDMYASDVYWEESPENMGDAARRIVDMGIKTVKAHIGFHGPADDARRVQALREAIGPNNDLMIDLNCGYNYSQALEACERWEEYRLRWLEEPLSAYATGRFADLREHSRIPIAAGENEFRIYGFKKLFDEKAVDVAMPDIGRVGGILETKNVCSLADAYGIEVSPHNFSSGVLLAATMHLMCATSNTALLEFDTSKNAIYHEFFPERLQISDGRVRISDRPGLGVELNKGILDSYCVR